MKKQQAIRAYCKGCNYDPQDKGTWLDQVEACTITNCELYEHRPLTTATRQKIRDEKVAQMNPEQLAAFHKKQEACRRMAEIHEQASSLARPIIDDGDRSLD